MTKPTKRLNLVLSETDQYYIGVISKHYGIGITDAMRMAVRLEAWQIKQIQDGNKILIERDGKVIEVERI